MFSVLIRIVEVILVFYACEVNCGSGKKSPDDSKIVGGFNIDLSRAPFLASLQKPSIGHYCGASLLTLGSVLTGCHCLASISLGLKKEDVHLRDWTDITVNVGSEDIDEPNEFRQSSRVRSAIIHPECSFERYLINDYGVLFLTKQFKISPKVHPFDLVSMDKRTFDAQTVALINNKKSECFVAGWGATAAESNVHSFNVKAVRMMLIPDQDCREKLGRENTKFRNFDFGRNAQTCSLSYGVKKNASDCVGDSGGPFFCGKYVFALVSYGYDCGFWDTPNVYAKLSFFVEWYAKIKGMESKTTMDRELASVSTTIAFIYNSSPPKVIFHCLVGVILQIYL